MPVVIPASPLRAFGDVTLDIVLGDPAFLAGARDFGQIDIKLAGRPAYRWAGVDAIELNGCRRARFARVAPRLSEGAAGAGSATPSGCAALPFRATAFQAPEFRSTSSFKMALPSLTLSPIAIRTADTLPETAPELPLPPCRSRA